MGLLSRRLPVEPKKRGVSEGEDAAVRGHQPVALPVRGGGHAHDGLVEVMATHRPVEPGIAEGEDAAVRRHQPVAAAVGGGRHADHRPVQRHGPGRSVEPGVPEGEDAAVGCHQPVPLAGPGPGHAHHRLVEMDGARSSRRTRPRRRRRPRRRTPPTSRRRPAWWPAPADDAPLPAETTDPSRAANTIRTARSGSPPTPGGCTGRDLAPATQQLHVNRLHRISGRDRMREGLGIGLATARRRSGHVPAHLGGAILVAGGRPVNDPPLARHSPRVSLAAARRRRTPGRGTDVR